ncbi:MAG: hypothetical protein MJ169_07905 [Treponema sp.]|nr:hypothetical protein [Treponema sp.]
MHKKLSAFFAVLLCALISGFAKNDSDFTQVLLPVEVFVGDQAEIRCTFRSAIDFFPGEEHVDRKELANPFVGLEDTFSVVRSQLIREDMQYSLSVYIIPWKTGIIEFPTFNLNKALGIVNEDGTDEATFSISFEPIEIKSIVEKTGNSQMMPPVPPIIVPGTTYVIFGLVVLAVIILIFLLRFLLKFQQIRRSWHNYLMSRAYKKNADAAVKKIKKLNKNTKISDAEFCQELQAIVRAYLEFRFDRRFTAISSGAVRQVFKQICADDIPDDIEEAVEDISAMFVRTDYIRYAHDSIDSQLYPPSEHQALLVKDERKTLSNQIFKAISSFEKSDGLGGEK